MLLSLGIGMQRTTNIFLVFTPMQMLASILISRAFQVLLFGTWAVLFCGCPKLIPLLHFLVLKTNTMLAALQLNTLRPFVIFSGILGMNFQLFQFCIVIILLPLTLGWSGTVVRTLCLSTARPGSIPGTSEAALVSEAEASSLPARFQW